MQGERVAVAMSGGVDSSVAAALLVEQGYEVVGLTMQIWPKEEGGDGGTGVRACCGVEAVEDARRVARAIGIRHYVVNLREAFHRLVIAPFCDEYLQGRTPNPCILCNTRIKFGALLRRAEEIGARRLATGHYASVGWDQRRGRWVIRRAADRSKDQSYTLYDLKQEHLAKALFPLGETRKTETRARARQLGLSVAAKPDSQQICFVTEGKYGEYVERERPGAAKPGPIVDREGRQIGRHRGISFYTIGQRHGLRVAHGRPLYVVGMEAAGNRIVVGEEQDLLAGGLVMGGVNWVSVPGLPAGGGRFRVKVRYGAPLVACAARPEGEKVRLRFSQPQRAVAPGQAAVCYEGDAVAFGGMIESS